MFSEYLGVAIVDAVEKQGRALYIGKEKRNRAGPDREHIR